MLIDFITYFFSKNTKCYEKRNKSWNQSTWFISEKFSFFCFFLLNPNLKQIRFLWIVTSIPMLFGWLIDHDEFCKCNDRRKILNSGVFKLFPSVKLILKVTQKEYSVELRTNQQYILRIWVPLVSKSQSPHTNIDFMFIEVGQFFRILFLYHIQNELYRWKQQSFSRIRVFLSIITLAKFFMHYQSYQSSLRMR